MTISELKQQLLRERPKATEAQLNKAVIDYAEYIDFPSIIRHAHDFVDCVRCLDEVIKGEA